MQLQKSLLIKDITDCQNQCLNNKETLFFIISVTQKTEIYKTGF